MTNRSIAIFLRADGSTRRTGNVRGSHARRPARPAHRALVTAENLRGVRHSHRLRRPVHPRRRNVSSVQICLRRERARETDSIDVARSFMHSMLATGKITGKKGETFAAGRLGERTVGDDGEVILGPAVIVTPENVNSFAF